MRGELIRILHASASPAVTLAYLYTVGQAVVEAYIKLIKARDIVTLSLPLDFRD